MARSTDSTTGSAGRPGIRDGAAVPGSRAAFCLLLPPRGGVPDR